MLHQTVAREHLQVLCLERHRRVDGVVARFDQVDEGLVPKFVHGKGNGFSGVGSGAVQVTFALGASPAESLILMLLRPNSVSSMTKTWSLFSNSPSVPR